MKKQMQIIKQWSCVTLVAAVLLVASFLIYFKLFSLLERLVASHREYGFVPILRVGYGIVLLFLCVLLYLTKLPDCLKASFLTMGMASFLIAISVQLYRFPWAALSVSVISILVGLWVLHRYKKKWYHFYAVLLVVPCLVVYM